MLPIKNYQRPIATVSAGLLACAVAFGCSKKEQPRTDAATSAGYGDTTRIAAAPADTTLQTSQGGTVAGSVTTTPAPDGAAGVAHHPEPGARADATPERRQPRTARRAYTGTQGGNVAPRLERRDADVTARTGASAERASVDVGVRREPGALNDTTAGAAIAAPVANLITAEPQIFTVIMLANIGDSGRAVRMCLNPATTASEPLRAYVQQEIRDHAQLNARANQMARQKSVTPTRSQVSDQVFQRNQDQPRADENPRDFLAREAQVHQDILTALDQQLIPNVRDSALRTLLADGRVVILSHLTRAQQLQSSASIQPAASVTAQAAASVEVSADPANEHNKPLTVAPQYGQPTTTTMTVTATPPAAAVATTTTTTTPAPVHCDVVPPRDVNQAIPGLQLRQDYQMRPDTSRGFDSRVGSDSLRLRPDTSRLLPTDTTRARPDTTRARPTPPRP